MDQAEDLWLKVDGLRLHGLRWPGRGVPLVLLHGSLGHARLWDAIAGDLAGAYPSIALDLRGHGQSDRAVPPDYRFSTYAAEVQAAIGTLGIERAVLAGHSMGSLIATRIALEAPPWLAGIAMIDIEASPPPHQARRLNEAGTRPGRTYATLADGISALVRRMPALAADVAERVARNGLRQCADGAWEEAADRETLLQFEQVDDAGRLTGITCPALVLRGADSTVMRAEPARAMAEQLPRGQLVEIAGAGHQLLVEQPSSVAAALRAWLDREYVPNGAGRA